MTRVQLRPAGAALAAALAALAASALAEPARSADGAPPAGCERQVEQGAASTAAGATQSPPDQRGAPTPAAQSAAAPHSVITLSGSNRTPCAQGTLPAAPAAKAGRATKTRSNIQNN